MQILELKDSNFANGETVTVDKDKVAPCMYAVDKLRDSFNSGEISRLSLFRYSGSELDGCPIWYEV